jgi:esterase/lipase superfamily enzyme
MKISQPPGITSMLIVSFILALTSNVLTTPAPANAAPARGKSTAQIRTVPFITTRNRTSSEDPADFFGGERGTTHAGNCDVARRPLRALQALAKASPIYIPDETLNVHAIRVEQPDDLLASVASSAGVRPLLIYTHGFFISFERGCKRASIFQDAMQLENRFLFFSWPSDGNIVTYTHDEADLFWSVDPFGDLLNDMVLRFGKGKINIAAHSLGARAVFLALLRMAYERRGEEPLINQVVLLAPDIDAGIFKQHLPLIRSVTKNITIYVSSNDQPLPLSNRVHGHPRLGETGTHLDELPGVEIIDISDLNVRYPSGHLYHLYNSAVAEDFRQLINHGKHARDRPNLRQTDEYHWRLQPKP